MGIKCFFMDPTDQEKVYLRRYPFVHPGSTCTEGYHSVMNFWKVAPQAEENYRAKVPHDNPLWPKICRCGYEFKEDDYWQVFTDPIYRRCDTGELITLREAAAGAMWYATWMPANMYWDDKPDADHLMVRLPDGTDWNVDSRASNCQRKEDRLHRCWHREGIPPNVTVTKGPDWEAGAGSVQSPGWHGYLRKGELVT